MTDNFEIAWTSTGISQKKIVRVITSLKVIFFLTCMYIKQDVGADSCM